MTIKTPSPHQIHPNSPNDGKSDRSLVGLKGINGRSIEIVYLDCVVDVTRGNDGLAIAGSYLIKMRRVGRDFWGKS